MPQNQKRRCRHDRKKNIDELLSDEVDYTNELKCSLLSELIRLPMKAQEIILAAPYAFFGSLTKLYKNDDKYLGAKSIIGRFRDLGDKTDKPMQFQFELTAFLAAKKIFTYYDDLDNWRLFDMTTDYRLMVKNARERRVGDHARGFLVSANGSTAMSR